MTIGRGSTIGEKLINDPHIPLVSATGSTRMGRRIGGVVGERLGRSILELGGNNAIIISEKADLVRVIDPATSEWREPFAKKYIELRTPKKNPTWDLSYDLMADVSYFGTMMVHEGHADGMVSGSNDATSCDPVARRSPPASPAARTTAS